jgi:hypothetical protein
VELWQAVLEFLRHAGVTSEPWGRDRGRVEELFAELYVLGERPSADDVRAYLLGRGVRDGRWLRETVRLWRARLRQPTRQHRGEGGWAYPFAMAEHLVAEHGLRSIDDRLSDALVAAASAYLEAAAVEPGGDRADQLRALFLVTAQAVDWRALSRDRYDDIGWPRIMQRRRGPDRFVEMYTRAGRARERARLQRWEQERDEAEAAWRERELPAGDHD